MTYRTVLIEDDPYVAQVNARLVEAAGPFEIVAVHERFDRALAVLRRLSPDLVLLDIHLPDGNGLDLAREIRAAGLPTEIIMITASSQQAGVAQALHAGALDYLVKPFSPERLRTALQRFLQRAALQEKASVSQQHIDSLLTLRPLGRLPKGIDEITLQEVETQLRSGTALSTDELGERLGLSRVTAWRYLEYLVSCQQASTVLVYGSVGRPTKKYQLARAGPGRDVMQELQ